MTAALSPPVRSFFDAVQPRRTRTLAEFAVSEIVLPDGPRQGSRLDFDLSPHIELILIEYDNPYWRRYFTAGAVQSGKTLVGFVVPLMYTVFELCESCIIGVPVIDMASGIWEQRVLPIIRRSRFRHLLPRSGPGSKGGSVRTHVTFRHGITLRFMGAGGGDEQRSSYPSRCVLLTELDKMDEAGAVSREGDPTRQIEARTTSFGEAARVWGECTVSVPHGKIWREVHGIGSGGRIFLRCPHCARYLWPHRSRLVGWDQPTIRAAMDACRYRCQHCDAEWTEEDRRRALASPLLVHKTQGWAGVSEPDRYREAWPVEADPRAPDPDAVAAEPMPETHTLGVQYSQFHSGLVSLRDIAARHWEAKASVTESEEKALGQFVWTVPWQDDAAEAERLEPTHIQARAADYAQGAVPKAEGVVVLGVDVQKFLLYYIVAHVAPDLTTRYLDWGAPSIVPEEARGQTAPARGQLTAALDRVAARAEGYGAQAVALDCNYDDDGWVRAWAAGRDEVLPLRGRGHTQMERMVRKTGTVLRGAHWRVGDGTVAEARRQADRSVMWFVDSDILRRQVHDSCRIPLDRPGAALMPREIALPDALWVARHFCAEQFLPVREAGKGEEYKWVRAGKGRHDLLDCAAYARFAAMRILDRRRNAAADDRPAGAKLSRLLGKE